MKDKILKAIDKGLMNALSTDIDDQDIDFDHAAISNNASRQPEMDFAVENILRKCYETNNAYLKNIAKDCMTILECHRYGYKYHVRNMDDLQELLYARAHRGLDNDNIDGIGTFTWLDTTDVVTYVLNDAVTEIDLSEYLGNTKELRYHFIKIYSDKFRFGYVLINKWEFTYTKGDKFANNQLPMPDYKETPAEALNDFDGYQNTQNIKNTDANALILKHLQNDINLIKDGQGTVSIDAYIPSAGEMKLIDHYYPVIYNMLKNEVVLLHASMPSSYWTSTMADDIHVWYFQGSLRQSVCGDKHTVFPFYYVPLS